MTMTKATSVRYPIVAAGFDGGNGNARLVLTAQNLSPLARASSLEIRIPSYYLALHNEIYDVPPNSLGGLVDYLDGPRNDLHGRRFLVGFPAYQKSPHGYFRTVDDKRGKIKYALQMLLGCLATLPHRDHWNLFLIASLQDAKAFGEDLTQVLEGIHTVRFNDSHTAQVEIDVDAVVEEGVGAIATARSVINLGGQTLSYDFGNGTCIISVFGSKGSLVERKVLPGGVEQMIEAIAVNLETRKRLCSEGDRQIIRVGIENQTFEYGTTGWNFRKVYEAELLPWAQAVLAPALRAAAPWTAAADAKIAVGGGSQLLMIGEMLQRHGIVPLPDGSWANARGLWQLSQARMGKLPGNMTGNMTKTTAGTVTVGRTH